MFAVTTDGIYVYIPENVWRRSEVLRDCMEMAPETLDLIKYEDLPSVINTIPLDNYFPIRVSFQTIQWLQTFINTFHGEYPTVWTKETRNTLSHQSSLFNLTFRQSKIFSFISASLQKPVTTDNKTYAGPYDSVDLGKLQVLVVELNFLLTGFAYFCLYRFAMELIKDCNGDYRQVRKILFGS